MCKWRDENALTLLPMDVDFICHETTSPWTLSVALTIHPAKVHVLCVCLAIFVADWVVASCCLARTLDTEMNCLQNDLLADYIIHKSYSIGKGLKKCFFKLSCFFWPIEWFALYCTIDINVYSRFYFRSPIRCDGNYVFTENQLVTFRYIWGCISQPSLAY